MRTYSELQRLRTLEDRFHYLKLGGVVGESTFGFDRWINQSFYKSREWRLVRAHVIARDNGFDLGAEDSPILGAFLVHHMNPIALDDLQHDTENDPFDPEFLITTTLRTHNAVHYGDIGLLPKPYVERTPGDTRSW